MKLKLLTLLALLVFMFFTATVHADEANTSENKNLLTNEIDLFADTFFQRNLTDYHIPGAVFVVVENGEIVFGRGYGYADLENSIPVDPEKTMFCAGSVGKLVNWTALLQLYEKGQFELNDDRRSF